MLQDFFQAHIAFFEMILVVKHHQPCAVALVF
jgi:hypothetical protein